MLASLPLSIGAAACVLASFFDLRFRRIPNALTVALYAIAPAAAWASHGWQAAAVAVAVEAAVTVVGFGAFAIGLIGAGDAKLLAAMAALCGFPGSVEFLLYTSLCGGLLAAAFAASRGELLPMLARLHICVGNSMATGNLQAAVAAQSDARLPYALAASAGFALVALSFTVVPALRIAQ